MASLDYNQNRCACHENFPQPQTAKELMIVSESNAAFYQQSSTFQNLGKAEKSVFNKFEHNHIKYDIEKV